MVLPNTAQKFQTLRVGGAFGLPTQGTLVLESTVGREEGETFNDYLQSARQLRQVRLLDPERKKFLFYSQEMEPLRSEIT